jgi:acyl-CoA thioester hydrolase
MTKPEPFEVQVRFSDIDVMGHVNNAIYLSYFEMTRVHYFEQLLSSKWNYQEDGFLLARNEVDYILPIFLTDKPKIKLITKELGNKSFTFTYEIYVGDQLRTKGLSVMVGYNSLENKTIPIPDRMREALSLLKAE